MKYLWFALLFVAIAAYGQAPQPTPPFQLNVRVEYAAEKIRPDYAAFVYKTLREVPNVALVNDNPDAILMVTDVGNGKQYVCTFIVICPAKRDVDMNNKLAIGDAELSNKVGDWRWRDSLLRNTAQLRPMYYWGDTWTVINENPKVAIASAVKAFDARFVEKERRQEEDSRRYLREHPLEPFRSPLADKPASQP